MKKDFKHKKIAVVGLGVEGLSSVRYFAQKGADVTVLDQNPSFAKASEGKGSKEENDLIAVLKKIGCLFKFGKDFPGKRNSQTLSRRDL